MPNSINCILIVDADNNFSNFIRDSFQKIGWDVHIANDGHHAIQNIHQYLPDIILLDTELPVRDGITTCRIIKNDISLPRYFPIIMMTASYDRNKIVKSIESGCDDFILKPFKFEVLFNKVKHLVEFYHGNYLMKDEETLDSCEKEEEEEIIIYAKQVIEQAFLNAFHAKLIDYSAIQNTVKKMITILHRENILPLAFKMKSHNDYSYTHSINVSSLCMTFVHHLGWNDTELQTIGEGAFLHDIGMTGIDLQIYMKPEKLTDTEFSEIKKHPLYGKEILAKQNIEELIQRTVLEHHERIDGSGYPHQLRGKKLSKYGKLVSIVDVYDALTTDRCYRKAVDSKKAIQIMSELPNQFDTKYFLEFSHLVNAKTLGK